ncbi:MAG: hypothetical protein ACM3PS_06605 [Syntrophothermus sp.]
MDEETNRQKTVEVVDTSDQPAEGGRMVKETVAEHDARMNPENVNHDELAPLFENDAADKFRTRWLAIQSRFVDDPKASVKEADDLVADVIQGITNSFADRRGYLEKNWNGGGEASTEELRQALKQYRSFFDRLLSLQS